MGCGSMGEARGFRNTPLFQHSFTPGALAVAAQLNNLVAGGSSKARLATRSREPA